MCLLLLLLIITITVGGLPFMTGRVCGVCISFPSNRIFHNYY